MAEHRDYEKLEEQRDAFTLVTSLIFVCLFTGLANGFFELGARRSVPNMSLFRTLSLYVMPGLLCGFAWRKAGILLGAIVGAVVRLLSLVNLGFIMPYLNRTGRFSLRAAREELHGSLLALVIASAVAGAAAGALGMAISASPLSQKRWFRWLRKAALALLTLGIVAAGLMAILTFFPMGKARLLTQKLERLEKWMAAADTPLAVVIWLGLALTAVCLLAALGSLRRKPPVPGEDEETPLEQRADSAPPAGTSTE